MCIVVKGVKQVLYYDLFIEFEVKGFHIFTVLSGLWLLLRNVNIVFNLCNFK